MNVPTFFISLISLYYLWGYLRVRVLFYLLKYSDPIFWVLYGVEMYSDPIILFEGAEALGEESV